MSLVYVARKWHSEWEPLDMHERGRQGSDDATWDSVGQMTVASGYPTAYMNGARKQHPLRTLAIARAGRVSAGKCRDFRYVWLSGMVTSL
jgi:hypothetical protein